MKSQLPWARYLVDRGYPIIPTYPDSKSALESGWQYYNENHPDNSTLRRWFSVAENNIALCTGVNSGIIAFEFSGRDGAGTLRRIEKAIRPLPPTLMIRRYPPSWGPERGYDYGDYNVTHLFRFEQKLSSLRISGNLAVKGDGWYTMLPPSVVGGGSYEWYGDENEIVDLPDAFEDFLLEKARVAL
ncbi:bifunctional DNA primase/polymerase [Paenibacillus pasadenensis]|uniref:bifunctional DNA primase/polymerase n=1 Tax=Paenibacillus pasadenensis TaxID=217090 RepID=UPI002041D347|nr:bifunctional DNA primase/polymerase [Paenibacillus pasadenensis]MCM3746562.1 bifunctional DNA primase/polymerase [Paenibacillus pasadenensis]